MSEVLPELPAGWVWSTIGEVGQLKLGRQRSPEHHNGMHMRPYLRVANVFEDRLDLTDVKQMNFTPEEFEQFHLQPRDILLNEGQSPHLVGRPAMYRGEVPGACFQNTLIRFRSRPGIEPGYALIILRAQLHMLRFKRIAKITTNMAHLGLNRLSEVEFPVAPLAEQRRIVAELEKQFTRLDATVSDTKTVKSKIDQARTTVLMRAARGALLRRRDSQSTENNGRVHGDLRDSKGQPPGMWELPPGWTWVRVEQVGEVLLGRRRAPEYSGDLRKYFRVANVKDDRLEIEDVLEMPFTDSEFQKYTLEPGDILVSEGQSPELIGRSAMYRGEVEPAAFQATLHRFRAREGVLPHYAQAVFRAWVRQGVFRERCIITTNIAHLTLERFRAVPFPLPPLEEQVRIVAEVDRRLALLHACEALVDSAIARCTRLRQSLLKMAFEGRLVPQDPRDEPASVLLDRIRAARAETPQAARGRSRRGQA